MFSWKNNKNITVGGFIQCNMVRWYHAWIMNTQSSIIFLKHIFFAKLNVFLIAVLKPGQ